MPGRHNNETGKAMANVDEEVEIAGEHAGGAGTIATPEGLIEMDRLGATLYRYWSPGFGVLWRPRKAAERGWKPSMAAGRLLGNDGEIAPGWLLERALFMGDDCHELYGPGAVERVQRTALAGEEESRRLWRDYVAGIPPALRRAVAPLCKGQWPALMALAARPALARDLEREFAAAGTGYVNACLSLLAPRPYGNAELAAYLAAALTAPRHRFLARAAGRPVSKAAARILAKLDDATGRRAALAILRLAEDEAAARLRHMRSLCAANAEALPALPRRIAAAAAPAVLAPPATGFDAQDCLELRKLVRLVRRRAPERLAALAADFARARNAEAFDPLADRWRDRIARRPGAFAPPFPGTKRLVPLATRAALRDAGRRFGNCLTHAGPWPRGPVYEWRGRRPALVSLRKDEYGLWGIEEIAGPVNAKVPRGTCARIAKGLHRVIACYQLRVGFRTSQASS
jgi:hypothetical protein